MFYYVSFIYVVYYFSIGGTQSSEQVFFFFISVDLFSILSTFPHIIHVPVRTHRLPRDTLSQIKQNPFIMSDTFCSHFIYSSTGIIIRTHWCTRVQILLTRYHYIF